MEKLTLALLLAATFNLCQNPVETDVFAKKTVLIDEFGRTRRLVDAEKTGPRAAFLDQKFNEKKAPALSLEPSQQAEAAFPPKALFGF